MKAKSFAISMLAAMVLSVSSSGSLFANGMIFFEAQAETVVTGTVYFGTVLDEQGRPLSGAIVTIYFEAEHMEFVVRTGVDGRYRNASIRTDVDPSLVHVTVSRPGYNLVRAVPRTAVARPGLAREINFVFEPA